MNIKNERRYAVLMPLRGGSKSIPMKNIKTIAGRPLFSWSLGAAIQTGLCRDIYVSTDCDKIEQAIIDFSPDIKIIRRPQELASDTASTESVIMHAINQIECSDLITIQATSPLTSSADFTNAIRQYDTNNYDSLLTAVRIKRFFWDGHNAPLNYDPLKRPRRQDFNGWFMENGAFYITSRKVLLEYECRLGGKIGIFEMCEDTGIEIDEPADWDYVESLLLKRLGGGSPTKILSDIEVLVLDVDGTLTDAGMYYSPTGELLKKFSTRDGMGLGKLQALNTTVIIMTSEESDIVSARMKKLNIKDVFLGVQDKRECLVNFANTRKIPLSKIAYMGDDINDLACASLVGFFSCPSDAHNEVKNMAHHIASARGGNGAVRELCDLICRAKIDAKRCD